MHDPEAASGFDPSLQAGPQTPDILSSSGLMWGTIVTPGSFKIRSDDGKPDPQAELARCSTCWAYISSACRVSTASWECGICMARNSLQEVPNRSRYEFIGRDPPPELADECVVASLPTPASAAPATLLVLDLRQEGEGFPVAQQALLRALDAIPEPSPIGLALLDGRRVAVVDASGGTPHARFSRLPSSGLETPGVPITRLVPPSRAFTTTTEGRQCLAAAVRAAKATGGPAVFDELCSSQLRAMAEIVSLASPDAATVVVASCVPADVQSLAQTAAAVRALAPEGVEVVYLLDLPWEQRRDGSRGAAAEATRTLVRAVTAAGGASVLHATGTLLSAVDPPSVVATPDPAEALAAAVAAPRMRQCSWRVRASLAMGQSHAGGIGVEREGIMYAAACRVDASFLVRFAFAEDEAHLSDVPPPTWQLVLSFIHAPADEAEAQRRVLIATRRTKVAPSITALFRGANSDGQLALAAAHVCKEVAGPVIAQGVWAFLCNLLAAFSKAHGVPRGQSLVADLGSRYPGLGWTVPGAFAMCQRRFWDHGLRAELLRLELVAAGPRASQALYPTLVDRASGHVLPLSRSAITANGSAPLALDCGAFAFEYRPIGPPADGEEEDEDRDPLPVVVAGTMDAAAFTDLLLDDSPALVEGEQEAYSFADFDAHLSRQVADEQ